ncbi:MAG TPA: potassium channel family protein [Micromonospora sp.]
MSTERPYRRQLLLTVAACLIIVLLYFLIPVEPGATGARAALRAAATLVGVLAVAWIVLSLVRREIGEDVASDRVTLLRLAVALVGGLMSFALADYVIATGSPGQFVGMETRIDALYFALATLTTVGYGDVHPAGQLARAAVCAQMVFSVGVLATGASVLVRKMTSRPPPPPAGRR